MIDHRPLQQRRRPDRGRRIAALAGEEQRLELAEVVRGQQFSLRVLLLDRAHRGRRGEQHFHPVLREHPPERAGIGRADRLAFVHDAGAAAQQRRVDDVAVADHPADIGRRPVNVAGLDAVDHPHRVPQRHRVAAVVAHHAFGRAGRAGGVENIQRIGRRHRHAVMRRGRGLGLGQVVVAARRQHARRLLALQDQAGIRLVRRQRDRRVEQRLVVHDAAGLEAAGGRDDHLRSARPRCGWPARPRRSRRTPPNGSRPAARRPAWRWPPPAPSACRSPPGRRAPRPSRASAPANFARCGCSSAA